MKEKIERIKFLINDREGMLVHIKKAMLDTELLDKDTKAHESLIADYQADIEKLKAKLVEAQNGQA